MCTSVIIRRCEYQSLVYVLEIIQRGEYQSLLYASELFDILSGKVHCVHHKLFNAFSIKF